LAQKVFVSALAFDIFLWKLPMDQSFTIENRISCNNVTIEIRMNDVMEEKFEKNPIVQIDNFVGQVWLKERNHYLCQR
jgi:hypothetical protein